MVLFQLLQIAIGYRKELSHYPTDKEWNSLYNNCKIQSVLGFAFSGIQKLPEEQMPPSELYAKWQREALMENERRNKVAEICRKTCETHEKNGFNSCVLMPTSVVVRGERLEVRDEIGEFRGGDPKDIDILCWSKDKKNGKRTIVEYVNFQYVSSTKHIKPKVVRQHVDWKSGHIPMNVNFKSSYLNCPWYNKRLEVWVREMVERPLTHTPMLSTSNFPPPSPVEREPEGDNTTTLRGNLCELPVEFYVVYQLLHLYKRFFCEDLRFGHLLEYYYTLKTLYLLSLHRESARHPQSPCVGEEDTPMIERAGVQPSPPMQGDIEGLIENLGMRKFAGAVMYVLQTVFAMSDEYLLCKPDVRHGSFVLKMTNLAGEYGRAYERTRTLSHLGKIGRYLYWIKRNRPFITQYPSEMLFETYRKIVG